MTYVALQDNSKVQASRSKVQGPERVGGHPEWFAITAAVVAASAAAGSLCDASASRKAQERTTLDTTCEQTAKTP